jgi:hypothetical protein
LGTRQYYYAHIVELVLGIVLSNKENRRLHSQGIFEDPSCSGHDTKM